MFVSNVWLYFAITFSPISPYGTSAGAQLPHEDAGVSIGSTFFLDDLGFLSGTGGAGGAGVGFPLWSFPGSSAVFGGSGGVELSRRRAASKSRSSRARASASSRVVGG